MYSTFERNLKPSSSVCSSDGEFTSGIIIKIPISSLIVDFYKLGNPSIGS